MCFCIFSRDTDQFDNDTKSSRLEFGNNNSNNNNTDRPAASTQKSEESLGSGKRAAMLHLCHVFNNPFRSQ